MRHRTFAWLALAIGFGAVSAAQFQFQPSGVLITNSGSGRQDPANYAPDIRFPIETAPAFANSQVWGSGGLHGPARGGQCAGANYSYPWRDNYCETRDWDMSLCPSGKGHQGQDVRPSTCKKDTHWAVAVTDGKIEAIGNYSLYLRTADGATRYEYLHMSGIKVKKGQQVRRGAQLGKVSNVFKIDTTTTIHLHFSIRKNLSGLGWTYVPPYVALIDAYKRLLAGKP